MYLFFVAGEEGPDYIEDFQQADPFLAFPISNDGYPTVSILIGNGFCIPFFFFNGMDWCCLENKLQVADNITGCY